MSHTNHLHARTHNSAYIYIYVYFVFQSSEWFCANEKMLPGFFYAASYILKVLLAYTVDALFWFLGLNLYNLRWHTLSELNERGLFFSSAASHDSMSNTITMSMQFLRNVEWNGQHDPHRGCILHSRWMSVGVYVMFLHFVWHHIFKLSASSRISFSQALASLWFC